MHIMVFKFSLMLDAALNAVILHELLFPMMTNVDTVRFIAVAENQMESPWVSETFTAEHRNCNHTPSDLQNFAAIQSTGAARAFDTHEIKSKLQRLSWFNFIKLMRFEKHNQQSEIFMMCRCEIFPIFCLHS
jgi:hypothetical protein